MSLVESLSAEVGKVLALNARLSARRVPYAFGGAIAYNHWGVVRQTHDIDIDVFVTDEFSESVVEDLLSLGLTFFPGYDRERMHREGQVRLMWDRTPVDLFFAYHEFHDACRERIQQVDFGGASLPILAREDIATFKVLFNRPRDWDDIERILAVQGRAFDLDYVRGWLVEMLGADDSRIARLDDLARATWERTDHIQ